MSSAFKNNRTIPPRFLGEGENISPPVEWDAPPPGCKGFALICEARESPFVHWLIYNISEHVTSLAAGVPTIDFVVMPHLASQGINSFGTFGYAGPMLPSGQGPHHYVFTLYALDADLDLPSGLGRDALLARIDGHILDSAKLMGTYEIEAASEPEQKSA